MANFVGFLAARAAAGGVELRKQGVTRNEPATVLLLSAKRTRGLRRQQICPGLGTSRSDGLRATIASV